MRESTSEMSLIVAELEPRMPRDKITGANAGGVIRLQIRTRPLLHSGQLAASIEFDVATTQAW